MNIKINAYHKWNAEIVIEKEWTVVSENIDSVNEDELLEAYIDIIESLDDNDSYRTAIQTLQKQ